MYIQRERERYMQCIHIDNIDVDANVDADVDILIPTELVLMKVKLWDTCGQQKT
jgi:hypothetical protein